MKIPRIMYGTAWKKDRTAELAKLALDCGFRAIDTANQLKHYHEAGVGEAVKKFWAEGQPRDSLFLQTKFTSLDGQDNRLPYNPEADLMTQVRQSFESSLEHLGVDYLDSFLLHGPYGYSNLTDSDWEVWGAIEQLYSEGRVKLIGISNVSAAQLLELVTGAKTKPHFVQNRCFANRGWDRAVRHACRLHHVSYQGFSLLTANPQVMEDERVVAIATRRELTPAQLIFSFARGVGMVPLTGTTDRRHMEQDLRALETELSSEEIATIENIGE